MLWCPIEPGYSGSWFLLLETFDRHPHGLAVHNIERFDFFHRGDEVGLECFLGQQNHFLQKRAETQNNHNI